MTTDPVASHQGLDYPRLARLYRRSPQYRRMLRTYPLLAATVVACAIDEWVDDGPAS